MAAAKIDRLRTRADLAAGEAADLIREALRRDPDALGSLSRPAAHYLDARTLPSRGGWRFVMVSPATNRAVLRWLREHSSRPAAAAELWAVCLEKLHWDSGAILATRDELAAEVGISADEASRLLGELVAAGVILRQRERVPGMRGPGVARFYVHPHAATHLGGAARDRAQAAAPPLHLVPVPAAG